MTTATPNEVRRAARRIRKTSSDFRFGKPGERDFIIDCCEALGINWHDHEETVEALAEELYEDAGETYYTATAIARFAVTALKQEIAQAKPVRS